jgi:5-formyltetrahydrofolate cyclo-ligase
VRVLDKPELRRRMRMVRDMVDDHLMRSVQLWAQVAELPEYRQADTVLAFVSFNGEPDTDPLFARLSMEGKRLVLPRVEASGIVAADGGSPRAISKFGVHEPTGPVVDVGEINLVIVPGLAFSADGHRLGYGGGHYDRFLPTVAAPSVGVCFIDQLVDQLPLATHDVPVGRVVSA